MTILVLCREEDLKSILAEYAREIRSRGIRLACVERRTPHNCSLDQLLRRCPEPPAWILHPESELPLLPAGLAEERIPTMCFQVDTYAYLKRRLRWASLFDHVAVFHPGYDGLFRHLGQPGAFVLPHAVRRELFDGDELERTYDLGWVGQHAGPLYRRRAALLPQLASAFKMNEWNCSYTAEELAKIYRRSRIVVNIGRDDYPQDANLRAFEAMAGGALLITSLPSELIALGFIEGIHFVGYRDERDLFPLIRRYLQNESARHQIAEAGRERVLRDHTYDRRVDALLQRMEEKGAWLTAPARAWSEARVRLSYLDYYAAHGAVPEAAAELSQIARHSVKGAAIGLALLGRAWAKQWRAVVSSPGSASPAKGLDREQ